MRMFKLIVAFIVVGLIGLFIWENMLTWKMAIPFRFELPLLGRSEPKLEFYLVSLFFAGLGFLAGVAMMMKPYFKVRRNLARERQERKEPAAIPRQAEAS